ncbi:hypothetical protein F7018_00555 [Tenacibaculum aiptasiae]|uniref:Outer membrane protein beta-barrel domain-containing protein n=1 Tax=Tenacibaculum aiptasiae TaxID=426481 RepID=A0A7J5AS57_9FLAO|nr:hypothetical protein [Tenacibaculum aiptasiae]KAB1160399.1 hypothetical protein F7018_00555 [Tenacibaculum aiptasiae]
MDDYKDIDRLFQEKLENFETTPSPEIWEAIESKLQKKKKRRIIPLWWYGGIAGVLIIGMLFIYKEEKSEPIRIFDDIPVIVEENKEEQREIKFKEIPQIDKDTIQTELVYKENYDLDILKNKKIKRNKKQIKPLYEDTVILLTKEKVSKDNKKGLLSDEKIALKKIFSEKENEELIAKTDSVFNKEKKKDFLAEVSKLDNIKKEKVIETKWSVIPTVAIINSNSFSKTSPLDKSFASNTNGENSITYGVRVNYKLNKKWSLQTGFFKRNLDFSTNNLSVVSNVSGSNLKNLNYNSQVSFILISNNELSSDSVVLNGINIIENNVSLKQTFGYIEVPIELKYTLIEKQKFNTKLVSGFSTLFLNDNNIYIETKDKIKDVGTATNLSSINFSGNLGLDFNYSLNNKLNLNITPMFKVQMNTFSNTANGFQPYTIGIYSGLSYKF